MKKLLLILLLGTFMSFNNSEICKETIVSFYGAEHHGKRTASSEIFNMYDFTAAHKTLKFGTKVKVTNLKNNKSVIVRINDRGPFVKNRDLDLSFAAFKEIENIKIGKVKVTYQILN